MRLIDRRGVTVGAACPRASHDHPEIPESIERWQHTSRRQQLRPAHSIQATLRHQREE